MLHLCGLEISTKHRGGLKKLLVFTIGIVLTVVWSRMEIELLRVGGHLVLFQHSQLIRRALADSEERLSPADR